MNNSSNLSAVRIFDNGGNTKFRFTAIYMHMPESNDMYAAREINARGTGRWLPSAAAGDHLGKQVAFTDLPASVRKVIEADVKYPGARVAWLAWYRDSNMRGSNDA
jgi:hypothetical protein